MQGIKVVGQPAPGRCPMRLKKASVAGQWRQSGQDGTLPPIMCVAGFTQPQKSHWQSFLRPLPPFGRGVVGVKKNLASPSFVEFGFPGRFLI